MSRLPIGLILAVLVVSNTGCGQSHEETKAQREAERQQEEIRKQEEIASLERRFNASYFPPKGLNTESYTYEIQRFFQDNSDRNIVFHAFMRDIESQGRDVIAVLATPIPTEYYGPGREVVFRLVTEENELSRLLEGETREPYMEPDPYFDEPDYVVVASIQETRPIRKYEVYGSNAGEYVEIEEDESRNVLAKGSVEEVLVVKNKDE